MLNTQKKTKKDSPPNNKTGKIRTAKEKECISLSTTKHSCVLHSLRKKTKSGKLTQEDKFKGIQASPSKLKVGGKKVIPDVIIGGKHVIDCKFPCATGKKDKAPAPLKMEKCTSDMSKTGKMKETPKEKDVYPKIEINGKRVKSVKAMTPKDAKAKKGKCTCQYKNV
ncbi:hypothetical protein GMJAKD_02145 [Candidatus Electrothrix aarhusensis]